MDIPAHLNELYHLSKWSRQVDYIDNLDITNTTDWLLQIDSIFCSIPADRKDKFYYLIDRLCKNIFDIEMLDRIPNIRSYVMKKCVGNFSVSDVLTYLVKYRVHDYDPFLNIEMDTDAIRGILKSKDVLNRELFYLYLKK